MTEWTYEELTRPLSDRIIKGYHNARIIMDPDTMLVYADIGEIGWNNPELYTILISEYISVKKCNKILKGLCRHLNDPDHYLAQAMDQAMNGNSSWLHRILCDCSHNDPLASLKQ